MVLRHGFKSRLYQKTRSKDGPFDGGKRNKKIKAAQCGKPKKKHSSTYIG